MLVVSRAIVALKILHHLAVCPGGVAQKKAMAKAISQTPPYTGKIALELLRAGFIRSVRGPHGGYALALPASSIRVGDVVQFVDDTRSWRVGTCPDNVGVRAALKGAQDRFFEVLNEHSIADLCMLSKDQDRPSKLNLVLPAAHTEIGFGGGYGFRTVDPISRFSE
ncbi:Rrf2 family transcriptional regulator [Hyphomicrobium sp.]|uniref:RrF2 family transcriptional regulator n=1 Tax=Hyphomicrobium sp. TaxID=82 RepID=UPI0025C6F176|nr:Rrf2 family transcriptional regulator [Hyphomicrobium sp.]MCC7250488.1 Rrf2 family transcriptional regulator [Hyphomicrobium sp.]